jgi:hypothetical protein
MSGFSISLAQDVINYFFRNNAGTVTPPAALYVSLHITDPTDDASVAVTTEVAGAWYARKAVTFAAPTGTTVQTANSGSIEWSPVTTEAVVVGYLGIWDSLTGGDLLGTGALTVSKTLNIDDVYVINSGSLVLVFD